MVFTVMESPLISLRTPQVLCHTPPFSYSIDSFLKVSQTPNSPTSTKLMESTLILNPSLLFAILSLGLFSHIAHIPFFSAFLSSYWRTLAWKIPWTEEPGRLQSMGSQESDTTERLPFHFSLSCIGEGNGNPLQCSCLENPRDRGAWWAALYGVPQSRTQLKRLSSSSSSKLLLHQWN